MAKKGENGKKIAILTSGGDASGMNPCIRATARYAFKQGYEVYGVMHGYLGLMNDEIFKMEYNSVSNTVHAGGTWLKSGRSKDFKEKDVVIAAAENLLSKGINNLVAIGGDGTFHGVEDLHKYTALNVIGIPATIDNDMGFTDYTIGFDTACNTVIDAMLKLRDTITSHDRIMVLEVMGRNCGDIALYSSVAGGAEYCLIPEMPIDIDAIAQSVQEGIEKGKQSTIIVMAEGVKNILDELMTKVANVTGKTVNHVALSYMQRGGIPSMSDRILATRLALRAVDLINCSQSGRVVGVRGGEIFDMSVSEALRMKKPIDESLYEMAKILSKKY